MAQTFRIATSRKYDNILLIGNKSKVSEDLFWNLVETKVKALTYEQPDKYDEAFQRAKNHLLSQKSSLTIDDTWFEIRGRS